MGNYEAEGSRRALAKELALESMVLLKNDDRVLPLEPGKTLAVFGQASVDTVFGGGGSGASITENKPILVNSLKAAGINLIPELEEVYSAPMKAAIEAAKQQAAAMADPEAMAEHMKGLVASGMIYELFGKYTAPVVEPEISDELVAIAAGRTDTAMIVIGRASGGEECDRHIEDDYYLIESEKKMIEAVCPAFDKVIVIYNVNGAVDTAWMKDYPSIKAAVFMGTCGEACADALADLLIGKADFSGKLSQTLALSYEDYPTAKDFSCNKDDYDNLKVYADYGLSAEENGAGQYDYAPVTVYTEGQYVGYRYFSTAKKEVMFPFGHGLSYADFVWNLADVVIVDGKLYVEAAVRNVSEKYSGKEVMQLYVNAPAGRLEQPYEKLVAFGKTEELAPGEAEAVMLEVPIESLASFDEEKRSYVIEAGVYRFLMGTSSVDNKTVFMLNVPEEIPVRKCIGNVGLADCNRGKLKFLSLPHVDAEFDPEEVKVYRLAADALEAEWPEYKGYDFSVPAVESTLADVKAGKVSMEAFVNQLSVEELAALLVGYGSGLPFGGMGADDVKMTIQYEDGSDIAYNSADGWMQMGYLSPAIRKYGIVSATYKDGPASVGKTAWPTGMMLSCAFNTELLYEFGAACGAEAESLGVDSWLGPGMNIIRNPIAGRDFEYFSEDPYLCGACGTAIAQGARDNNNVTCCPKHFALNEQETYRRGKTRLNIGAADSIVDERTAREIYLKPFEMVITGADVTTIMTSFNKINGTYAAGHKGLNTDILRKEWGYDGVVVTDWGDLDEVVYGADAVAAGNDVVMPGGPPVIREILDGYEAGRVTLDEMREGVAHLMNFVIGSKRV